MESITQANKKGYRGCLLLLLAACVVAALFLIPIACRPYLREMRPVTVTVTDEAGQPVPNAVLAVYEFEWIFYVPILAFASPSQLVEQHQTVTTDSNGRAQFAVRFTSASTSCITLADQILRVVSYQTTDSFLGPRERFYVPSRSDYGIEWGAVSGVSKLSYDTNIVVSTAQPK
jgi:hypothetical protein